VDTIKKASLKYNKEAFKNVFVTKGNMIITTKDIKVVFPERYKAINLVELGSVVKIVNIYSVLDDNKNYVTSIAPVYNFLTPTNIQEVMIDDTLNIMLEFEAGTVFATNNKLVRNESFMFNIFDEFFIKGKIPWFLQYDQISNLFLEAKKYAGSKIGDNPLTMEIIAAIISRNEQNKQQYYRQNMKGIPVHVGLNNIYYSFDNTSAKLVGAYFGAGVSSAIVNKEKKPTVVADMLRA